MKKKIINYIVVILGFSLLAIGLYLIKIKSEPQGVMRALPYVCVGLGSGIWGHGMGEIISQKVLKKHPGVEKQTKIDKFDERNVAIGNRAKAKAYDMMIFLFGVLMITFVLMDIDVIAILLLVFVYLFVVGYGIYYRYKFDKEM